MQWYMTVSTRCICVTYNTSTYSVQKSSRPEDYSFKSVLFLKDMHNALSEWRISEPPRFLGQKLAESIPHTLSCVISWCSVCFSVFQRNLARRSICKLSVISRKHATRCRSIELGDSLMRCLDCQVLTWNWWTPRSPLKAHRSRTCHNVFFYEVMPCSFGGLMALVSRRQRFVGPFVV